MISKFIASKYLIRNRAHQFHNLAEAHTFKEPTSQKPNAQSPSNKNQEKTCIESEFHAAYLRTCKTLSEIQVSHAQIILHRLFKSIYLTNTLLNSYIKLGTLRDAGHVFDKIRKPNVVAWTAMITVYGTCGLAEEALVLYKNMVDSRIAPNEFTHASVLPCISRVGILALGRQVHLSALKGGFVSDVFVRCGLLDMYANLGDLGDACQVFDEMPRFDAAVWTAMISGYAGHGHMKKALSLFKTMPQKTSMSWCAIISGCAKNGHLGVAAKIFWENSKQDGGTWNAMISGYSQQGHPKEALRIFREMKARGMRPDSDSFIGVLVACTELLALEKGRDVHKEIARRGLSDDVVVGNALVNMYSKCGSIDEACQFFHDMPVKDTVSWTTVIVGCADHGLTCKALALFEEMTESSVHPDYVTFLGVLLACCRGGMVNTAWEHFHSMKEKYHLPPKREHCCCMVDLLGQVGHLNEAVDFIYSMPFEPDEIMWTSLLHSCRIHKNPELGRQVARNILELDPENASASSLLLDLYKTTGMWNDFETINTRMRDHNIRRVKGCSLIAIGRKFHAFETGERFYKHFEKMQALLQKLHGEMKEVGYVPEKGLVLNDIMQQHKENIVSYHSEMLALSFGLLRTTQGMPLRIHNNLVVCSECHSSFKLISKLVAREIILRDPSRFHHFKEGRCSCADQW